MAIRVKNDKCKGCKLCVKACPFDAIDMVGKLAVINEKCTACAQCIAALGSVSPNAPNFSPFAIGTRYFCFCSSVP
jgi:ferredoxin